MTDRSNDTAERIGRERDALLATIRDWSRRADALRGGTMRFRELFDLLREIAEYKGADGL